MTVTDEFRALLDYHDIHWEKLVSLDNVGRDIATVYRADHAEWIALEDTDESLNPTGYGINVTNYRKPLTPKQVVVATLGRGKCQIETTENWLPAERYHRCKGCGAFFAVLDASHDIPPRYCPNCGRKVVDG